MGAMKRFAEEVSVVLGQDGEITDHVLAVGEVAMNIAAILELQPSDHSSDNPKFQVVVEAARDKLRGRILAELAFNALTREQKTEQDRQLLASLQNPSVDHLTKEFPFMLSSTRKSKSAKSR